MSKDVEIDISAVCPGRGREKFARFLEELAPVGPGTARKYLSVIRGLLGKSDTFSLDQAVRLIKKKNRIYVRAAVIKFIDFLEHEGALDDQVATLWRERRIPKIREADPRPREIPSQKEIMDVINSLEKDERLIARFMLYTGCRVHEAVGVKPKDVNFKTGNIIIYGKGRIRKKPRPSKLPQEFTGELESYVKTLGLLDTEFIFWPNSRAKVNSRATMFRDKLRAKSLEKLGRPIGTHDIRRFGGTYLYNLTRDIQLVQKFLGHRKIETTKRYTQYATKEEQLDQARDYMSRIK